MQTSGMTSNDVSNGDSPTPANLFDEFEEAFQNCLAPLTKEDPLNGVNQEELRANAEANSQKFLELAQRMEAFFLQKRFLLSVQKPEMLLMEENQDMRQEIARKDELIKKINEKIPDWQNALTSVINRVGAVPPTSARGTNISGGMGTVSSGQSPQSMIGPGSVMGAQGNVSNGTGGPKPSTSTAGSMGMGGMSGMSHTMGMMGQTGKVGPGGGPNQMSPGQATSFQSVNTLGSPSGPQMGSPMGASGMNHPSPMGPTNIGHSPQGGQPMSSGTMYHGPGQMGGMGAGQAAQVGLQGPLAYLEKTTTNIGITDTRR